MIIASYGGNHDVSYGAGWPSTAALYGSSFALARFEVSLDVGSGLLQFGSGHDVYPSDAVTVVSPSTTTHGLLPTSALGLNVFSTEEDPLVEDVLFSYVLAAGAEPFVYRPETELSGYEALRWTVQALNGAPSPQFNIYLDI